jgi:hypothetical protein
MSWEISISPEGWEEIRDALNDPEKWPTWKLVAAISDDFYGTLEGFSHPALSRVFKDEMFASVKDMLIHLTHDVLSDMAFELVEQNNTCDNGGNGFWIDREGYHKVYLPDSREESESED